MKKILNHLATDWYKYLLELIVITAGVLGAFALNNWNELAKESREEQVIFKQMLEDLAKSKSLSESYIEIEENRIAILTAALGEEDKVDSLWSSENSDAIAKEVFWNYQHEVPVFSSYEDFKSSGKTGLIKSAPLRAAIYELEEKINALNYAVNDRQIVHTTRIDALSERDVNFLVFIDRAPEIAAGPPSDYKAVLRIERNRNLIGLKLDATIQVLVHRIALDKEIAELMSMIEVEIK